MNSIKYFTVVHLLLFSFCLCEISVEQKDKFLRGIIDYYNNLPDQVYTYDDGTLLSVNQVDESTYQIEAEIIVTEIRNVEVSKTLKCSATVKDGDSVTVTSSKCNEPSTEGTTPDTQVEVTEPSVERKPVELQNEVQADTAITSGEQFIAIPRNQPKAVCIGCSTHVNPEAAGVSDLANLGVRHLDIHEPTVKHTLDSVIDVERQVQVVNGVRYILTLSVGFNNCTDVESESCSSSKTCKISILVKPWVKLPNGANYRAIVGNNCTEEWLYGDNGEVLPEVIDNNSADNKGNKSKDHDNTSSTNDDIQVKHNTDVQSQPNVERALTDEELKNLQEQIIPNSQIHGPPGGNQEIIASTTGTPDLNKEHVFKIESSKHNKNSIPVTESDKTEQQNINIDQDKKKAIDEMLDFFDFSGFKPKTEGEGAVLRVRRSYDYDLQVLSLAEDYHGIKKSIENARFVYEMAQAMVDYLNEMDMDIKNRAVNNVLKAEEEMENLQRFVYIQARVTIPCDKLECGSSDVISQICNGVIDATNANSPQILNTFCYNDNKERDYRDVVKEIPLDDPVLQKLTQEALKKIELESKVQHAMKINKIASAITQVTSGTLTKFSIIIDYIKCNKSVPMPLRINCTVIEQLGQKICEVIVHERDSLKERRISYTCTDRPVEMRISKTKTVISNVTAADPKIIEMLQEAIEFLESQSNKNNRQKIVSIKSISSQIVAGFLTKIEFVVGYTNCTDTISRDEINKCELLKNEALRSCKAQIWDRSWIMDGRQVEVSCDDSAKNNEIYNSRKKRSIDTDDQTKESDGNDKNVEYLKLANEALKRFMQSLSSRQHYKILKLDRVAVKNVPGNLIRIDFSISPTNCLTQSNGQLASSQCDIINSKNIFQCHSKILQNVWIAKKQYFINCNIKNSEQPMNAQGIKERNPNDPKYYQLAEASLSKYLNDTGRSSDHKIVEVEKVTTQIVTGLLTSIDFLISSSQSERDNKTIRCHSKILEKRWLGTKDFNVTCQMKDNRETFIEPNLNDPKYMQIAVESLQKYINENPESGLVRVSFVDKIESGLETEIRFIASHTEDDDGDTLCYAKFSDPSLNIEVKCQSIGKIIKYTQITDEDPKYYKYVELAEESLHNYLLSINSSPLYTIVSVDNVTVQWDDGIQTLISFIISPTDLENSELQGKKCLSRIKEQPWLYNKSVEVNCKLEKDLYRAKREVLQNRKRVLGDLKEKDPTDPKYKLLAQESLLKYKKDFGITQSLEVIHVEKVSTQVVSGSITYIDFTVSGNQGSNDIRNCHSKIWEQPWLNRKEISVSCQDGHLVAKRAVTGGQTEQDPNSPEYKALANESLKKYTQDAGITDPLQVARIEKVTTQVVSGIKTTIDFFVSGSHDSSITKCHSEIWEQSWLNKKEISVSCQDGHRVAKRAVTGGQTEQDPNSPEYKALANESLKKYTQDAGITDPLQVASIEMVTTQVVSGIKTTIDFFVSGSHDSSVRKCHSEIWEQSWLNKKEISVSCQDGHRVAKRGLAGGRKEQDPNSPQYKALADESLKKYTQDSGITEPLQVTRIEKVTTQVVSGIITTIDFFVSGSHDSSITKCHSEIWEQSWLNNKEISVTCQDGNQIAKRALPGGQTEQDPNSPEYKALADESLKKYTQDAGITDPLQVASIEMVTTQVVSGIKTTIDFFVSGSHDSSITKCHSEIWEQSWLNKKEISVSCQDGHRVAKRGLAGGRKEQDPNSPQYKALADESLKKYTQDSGITEPLQVTRIEKVTTRVVSGIITTIDFFVSGSHDSSITKCHSEIWEQSWLNNKEISVTCQDGNQIAKRALPGGQTEQDPNSPEYKALADESLKKYTQDAGITDPLQVASIEMVTTQVVSGIKTTIDFFVSGSHDSSITKCHSEIWEQSWLNKKEISVSCQDGHRVAKRGLAGGQAEQDPNSPEYKALADESLKKYTQDAGITDPLQVARIEKVTTQVVSGIKTTIDFFVSGSHDSSVRKCHSEVWEQSWLNKKEISVSCQDGHRVAKRAVTGGQTEQDPNSPEYKALADESLKKYTQDAGITDPLQVARIEKVTTQIVSGIKTTIDFFVSGSHDSSVRKCHSEIWEQSWLNKKEISVSCQDGHRVAKRGLAGGRKEQDPNSPQYKALADESLKKYTQDSGITEPLQVTRIEKVTTRVVSGIITTIDFFVSGSHDSSVTKCHSEIWEQSWLNNKEISVTCQDGNQIAKRALPLGQAEQDPNSPEYKALADESLKKYTQDAGITDPLQVASIEMVTTQVVSGIKTTIDFFVSGSHDSSITKCHSEIWEQSWLNNKEISVSCQDGHRVAKRAVTGGQTEQDPNSPQYKALADESLKKYTQDAGITDPLQVARIEKVTTQVVSGIKTTIDFFVSGSHDSSITKCHSEIWEQSWLNKKEISVSCQDGHRVAKRAVTGGQTEQDPNSSEYKALADESLKKYTQDAGITDPLQVARIEKVTTQVVSGIKTTIDFFVSGSHDSSISKCHSEIWEQSWLNKKEISVSCQDGHRVAKRAVTGGQTEQDPNSPQYKALADESLKKYTQDAGITDPLQVARIEKVTTQVVSGIKTTIDFFVSGSHDSSVRKCHSEIWEQSWLNKKEISVSCQDGHRVAKRGLAGGRKEQDPNSPQYKALADESLKKYTQDSGITEPLQVTRIEKVTTRVVSGIITTIDFFVSGSHDSSVTKCHSEIWEQSWLNNKEISVTCQDGNQIAKRALPLGQAEQDPNSPEYKALADESLKKYTQDAGITDPLQVARIEMVTTQVVSGIKTTIDFFVSGSHDSSITKCHSEIWEQSLLNNKEISVSCQDGHQIAKRALPGGQTEQDPNSPEYKALADESLKKYTQDAGITDPLQVASIEKVTTQVVSGIKTTIDFFVSGSHDSSVRKCHSEVWEQSWLNKKEISVSCQDGHRVAKRAVTGGQTEQDPNSPQYKALADESLKKYTQDAGITDPLQVARIEKVTTQVVSGIKTTIDFFVSGSHDSSITKCHSEIWEQSWLNKKEISVSCQDGHRVAKRAVTGGQTEQDPNSSEYKALADESLKKYTQDAGITDPLQVARIEKVTTQVVSGIKTTIDFFVSGSHDSSISKCHSEIWEQSWLNKKEISVSCQDGHRVAKRAVTGGQTEQDPNSPQYKALADESLKKYTQDAGITDPLQVARIEKVTTQVVSGIKTTIDFFVSGSHDSSITKCHSEIWEQSWLNKKEISVSCQDIRRRVKRHLLGGETHQDSTNSPFKGLDDELSHENSSQLHSNIGRGHDEETQDPHKPEYMRLAEESLRKYEKKSTVYHKVLKVESVVTRVVAGIKYKINFNAAPTACLANVTNVVARHCKAVKNVILYCHAEIWDRPWLRLKKIDVDCNGPDDEKDFDEYGTDIDFSLKPPKVENADQYRKLADEASEKYLTSSKRKYVHKVTEILSASEQVTDGTIINIEYSLSPTTCLRNETVESNKDKCKLKQPLVVFHCSARIWNRPWLGAEKEIQVSCKKINKQKGNMRKRDIGARNTRQIGDEEEEMDEETKYYYADRAIQHLNDHSHSNNLQKLISIHAVQSVVLMGTLTVRMYLEVAETFCLRHQKAADLRNCAEMSGLNHRLCYARLWPSPDDELIVRHVAVTCDDDDEFVTITGVNIPELIKLSIQDLERDPENPYKLVHQGEPQVIPTLNSKLPFKFNFVVGTTNCSKDVDLDKNPFQCFLKTEIPSRACHSFIWLRPETKFIRYVNAKCTPLPRLRRSAFDVLNITVDNLNLQKMLAASLQKLEMSSLHRYKQRVLQINSYSTKLTSAKVTTIDFDVGYTSCLKYEWVENITSCDFLDHLPRRRCVAQIRESVWINNGQNIDVNCVDDETPLESHIEFDSAEMANELARQALKHIEAKYPHPAKQKVVRIFSLEKQVVAGLHYKMKIEVGYTDCVALSDQTDCKFLKDYGINKFCRVNVWVRPWTDHPPNFRVSCDFQEGTTHDFYHHIQAEQLFYNFLTTYSPSYVNDYSQMQKRFEIFKQNVKKIHELNIHEKGTAVYGVTRFADLSYEEFSNTYMGLKTSLKNDNQVPMKQADIPNVKVPPNFDWREYDVVTEVKDQGSCGSCWAFSVTGNIEGQWKMQSGQLVSLSEQELVDCDKLDNGCNGGLPDNAYRAIEQLGGLELESDYPYQASDDKCEFNKTLAKVQISGAVNITSNETGMSQWLVQNGPISIGINANAMQFYMGGISHPWKMLCDPNNLDHGVLIVGYGIKDYPLFNKKLPFWIIKNSWGKSWGEQGYYRVYRGDGTCGVNQMASSAVI